MTLSGPELIRGARALDMIPEGAKGTFDLSAFQVSEIKNWLKDHPTVDEALNQAHLAIDEYYNGDRAWAERWLLRAYEANQKDGTK